MQNNGQISSSFVRHPPMYRSLHTGPGTFSRPFFLLSSYRPGDMDLKRRPLCILPACRQSSFKFSVTTQSSASITFRYRPTAAAVPALIAEPCPPFSFEIRRNSSGYCFYIVSGDPGGPVFRSIIHNDSLPFVRSPVDSKRTRDIFPDIVPHYRMV